MCDPATAMAVGKAGMEYAAESQAADAQQARFLENRNNSILARDVKIRQLNLRGQQELEKNQQEQLALQIESLRQQATLINSAGEANVSGNSVNALLRDYQAEGLRGLSNLSADASNVTDQLMMEREGLEAEMINRIGSVAQGEQPDLGMAVLSAGMGAAGAYAQANGTEELFGIGRKASAAVGTGYGTNPFSEQSLMLARQEF